MAKDNSTISRSDMDILYDRNKMFIYDLVDFARRNEANVTLTINSLGVASLKVFEDTNKMVYYNELTQDGTSIKHVDIAQKK